MLYIESMKEFEKKYGEAASNLMDNKWRQPVEYKVSFEPNTFDKFSIDEL